MLDNKSMLLPLILFIFGMLSVSLFVNFPSVLAPGRIGGGGGIHEPIRDTINSLNHPTPESSQPIGPEKPPDELVIGSGENLGYPSGSTVIAERLKDPTFGSSPQDKLLLNFFISHSDLRILENKKTFDTLIAPEQAKLHSNEPLPFLKDFISKYILIYLIPLLDISN